MNYLNYVKGKKIVPISSLSAEGQVLVNSCGMSKVLGSNKVTKLEPCRAHSFTPNCPSENGVGK